MRVALETRMPGTAKLSMPPADRNLYTSISRRHGAQCLQYEGVSQRRAPDRVDVLKWELVNDDPHLGCFGVPWSMTARVRFHSMETAVAEYDEQLVLPLEGD